MWLVSCFASSSEGVICDSNDVVMGCDGGEGVWLAPCFTSGEGVVVGDVLTITTKPKGGWSQSM